jgi:hypothetical protein
MPKIINTSHTTDTVGLPFLARSVDWLQDSRFEDQKEILNSINQEISDSEVWQLFYKNIRNTSGTTWEWNNGSVIYGNKVYKTTSGTATLGVGESLVYYFITTAQAGEPTTYTDNSSFQTNENIRIGICKNTENVSQQIQAVNLLRYINLEISGTGDLNWKLTKRGKVYTFTYQGTLSFGDGRLEYEILKNFSGSLYLNKVEFPCHFSAESLVNNNPYDSYMTRLFIDSGTLKVNIQSGTNGSISFIA